MTPDTLIALVLLVAIFVASLAYYGPKREWERKPPPRLLAKRLTFA